MRIPPKFRVALALKGALLVSLGVLFVIIAFGAFLHETWNPALRFPIGLLFAAVGFFLASSSRMALLDALTGDAVSISGAVALASRRAGYSLKLPDGHYAEYVLWNSWHELAADQRYSLVVGRRSRVIVARPEPDVLSASSSTSP